MVGVSALRDASDTVIAMRRPSLIDPTMMVDKREQRLCAQAWLRLGVKFLSFWGVDFKEVRDSRLPKEAHNALWHPRALLLENRYEEYQLQELLRTTAPGVFCKVPPASWCQGDVNRIALWIQLPESEQFQYITEALLARTSIQLQKAKLAAEQAMHKLVEGDLELMHAAQISYLAMNPVSVSKSLKRAGSMNIPNAPSKMLRYGSHPHLRDMVHTTTKERLFDEECATLPELN
jgi:hypothetical protein